MSKVDNRTVQGLITYYLKLYKGKHGLDQPSDFNRYRDRWGFQAMIEQFGPARARQIVDYYLATKQFNHPVAPLLYNYEKIEKRMREQEEDAEKRRLLREQSRIRVERWNSGERDSE